MKTLLQVDSSTAIVTLIISIGVGILIFLVLRDIVLWYYKINYRIRLQQEMNANLAILIKLQGGEPAVSTDQKKK